MQRDPAFQWESQALRESMRRRAEHSGADGSGDGPAQAGRDRGGSTASPGTGPAPAPQGATAGSAPGGAAPPPPAGSPATAPDAVPEGTMLIPIAAWDKMLLQLGNLHEAGQQLAEARERAGRAETEALFLRERLADLRDQLAEARGEPDPEPEPEAEEAPADEPAPDQEPERLWRYVFNRWQHRRHR